MLARDFRSCLSAQPSLSVLCYAHLLSLYHMLRSAMFCTALQVLVIIKLQWRRSCKTNQAEILQILWLVRGTGLAGHAEMQNISALLPGCSASLTSWDGLTAALQNKITINFGVFGAYISTKNIYLKKVTYCSFNISFRSISISDIHSFQMKHILYV